MFFLYKIFYNGVLLYCGSTTNIQRRKTEHKSRLLNGLDKPFYNYLRNNNIKFDDLVFEVIETDIKNIRDLRKEEGNFIKIFNPVCNKDISGRTSKEWYNDNIEEIKEKSKEYYEKNIETIKEKSKIYRENNPKLIKEYHKKWRKNNPEKIKERGKIYREQNKEKIKETNKEKHKKNYQQNRDILNEKRA